LIGIIQYADLTGDAIGIIGETTALVGAGLSFVPLPVTQAIGRALTVIGDAATLYSTFSHVAQAKGSDIDSTIDTAVQTENAIEGTDYNLSENSFFIPVLDSQGNIVGLNMQEASSVQKEDGENIYNFSDGSTVTINSSEFLSTNIGENQNITTKVPDGSIVTFNISAEGNYI